jgi:hypothetical protein
MAMALPKEIKHLKKAFIIQGFKPENIREKFQYDRDHSVSLAAFWRSQPFDQFTCGVVGDWIANGKPIEMYLDAPRRGLLPAYVILARPDHYDIFETVHEPTVEKFQPTKIASCSIDDVTITLEKIDGMRPDVIGQRKQRIRQMALFEMAPQAEQFRKWAYEPTQERIDKIIDSILRETPRFWQIGENNSAEQFEENLRWLVRLFALRIAWDKNMIGGETSEQRRPNAAELLRLASQHPTPLQYNQIAHELSEVTIDFLGDAYLQAVDGALVGKMIQQRALPKQLQKERKLYPTPVHIAWQMLQAIPIEVLEPENVLIWDGTCGTGTILTAALERFQQMIDPDKKQLLEDRLVSAIRGNDLQGLQVDSTRLALDHTLGKLQGQRWQITSLNITEMNPDEFAGIHQPTAIVSNPPFEGVKKQGEYAARVLNVYLDLLEPGALISVIIPRSLRSTAGSNEKALRARLHEKLEIFEVIELPVDAFPGAQVEADIVAGRIHYKHQRHFGVLTWRSLQSNGQRQSEEAQIIANSEVWRSYDHGLRSPLLAKLESKLAPNHRLSKYLGLAKPLSGKRFTQGIIPGKGARDAGDILDTKGPGAVRYIEGRTGMAPFYIPWDLNKKWLRYSSPRLHRKRPEHEWLFKSDKLFVSRHKTVGHSWAIRAAVDREGSYPSDQFIVLSPNVDCPFSLEQLAGLYNSSLINYWLRESHGGLTLRQERIIAIPLPDWQHNKKPLKQIEVISQALAMIMKAVATHTDSRGVLTSMDDLLPGLDSNINGEYRKIAAGDPNSIDLKKFASFLIRELDREVYKAYNLSYELANGIASYFLNSKSKRPGFEQWPESVVYQPLPEKMETQVTATETENRRMQHLLEKQYEASLSRKEEGELNKLIELWEHTQLAATKAKVEKHDVSNSLTEST